MKTTASIPNAFFFNPVVTTTGSWGEKSQRISRRPRRSISLPKLSTDDLAATKQEVVCGGILALCFLYTVGHVFAQLAS